MNIQGKDEIEEEDPLINSNANQKRASSSSLSSGSSSGSMTSFINFLSRFKNELLQIRNLLLISFMLLQASTVVLLKKVSSQMEHYPYVLTLTQPCCTTTLFGICAAFQFIIERKKLFPRCQEFLSNSGEYGNNRQFPKYLFGIMGILFILNNFMMFSGSRGELVPGPLIVLLQQTVIPISMVLSIIALKKRYLPLHYIGALLIIVGIILSLFPQFSELKSGGKLWALLLILGSTLPIGIAVLLIENSIKNKQVEIYWMWMWINVFEILAALPLVFAIIPIQKISLSETPTNIVNGYKCLLLGMNSEAGDDCHNVGYLYLAYVLVLVLNKINLAFIVKSGSATLTWIASTCAIPLANIAFSSKYIMGKNTTHFTKFLIIGLVVVIFGLILYRGTSEVEHRELEKETPSRALREKESKNRVNLLA